MATEAIKESGLDAVNTQRLADLTAASIKWWNTNYPPPSPHAPLNTVERCLAAVKEDGKNLRYVPPELRTEDICSVAFKRCPLAFGNIPSKHKTREMCLAAVKTHGLSIYSVPEKYMDLEIAVAAIKRDYEECADWSVADMTDVEEIFKYAFTDWWDLSYVPIEYRTPAVCLAAIKCSELNIEHVPKGLLTRELCLTAVKEALIMYDDRAANSDDPGVLFGKAVKFWGWSLEWVPEEYRTKEICFDALQHDGRNLKHVPAEYISRKWCMAVVTDPNNGLRNILECIPEQFLDKDMCIAAVTTDPWSLEGVPQELVDATMCLGAVQREPCTLAYVPDKFKTLEICQLAVTAHYMTISEVPCALLPQIVIPTNVKN